MLLTNFYFPFLLFLFLHQTTKEKIKRIVIPYRPDLKLRRMGLEAAYALENLLLCIVCANHRRGLIKIGGDTCRASEISVWPSAISAGIPRTDSVLCQTSAGIWIHWIRLTVFNPPKQYLCVLWSLQNIQVVVQRCQCLHKIKKENTLPKSFTAQKASSSLLFKSECHSSPLIFLCLLYCRDNRHISHCISLPKFLKYLRSYEHCML